MGQIARGYCPCGYDQLVRLGGVRSNHRSVCGYPFICHACRSIFTGNLLESSSVCSHCKGTNTSSYEERSLRKFREICDRTVVFTWSMFVGSNRCLQPPQELPKSLFAKAWHKLFPIEVKPVRCGRARAVILQQGGYRCPKCDGFSLSFESVGMID